ncbi:dipeptidase [Corynebacterium nuruki]|jgi:acetylornithine deacetylase/succinyl-diaminopimelate desuccinylase-like protein|uniref:dipeptidase n=1 Tax=Corynebacterium nuruki TaxID=1032851 RepID=UPI000248616D|nr:dipeptidase [Corynebacterium nuruki]MDN6438097.1 dipeptidase [Corynebacterium nuruki]
MTATLPSLTPDAAREAMAAQMPFIRQALGELVAYRSVHSTPGLEADNAGASDWVVNAFREVGVPVEAHETSDGSTTVIGLREPDEGQPTVLLYSHYDVQPATDVDNWTSSPWELTERDGRWYGRGAADCKGHVVLHLAVLRILNELTGPDDPKIGVRVVVEGSEERGGYGLEDLLDAQPELFAADTFLIVDSGNDAEGVPAVATALRGTAPVTVTVDTLNQPMHSGQYGGAAPDALLALIRLLSTLHDDNGLVAVDGLTSDVRWEGRGPDPETFRRDAGVLDGVDVIGEAQGLLPNDLTVARPSITVTGLDSLTVADAVNAVPGHAAAHVSLRIPPGMDPKEGQDALVRHLESHVPGHAKVTIERDTLASPFSADTSGPALALLMQSLADAYGAEETAQIGSGGSIPLSNALLEKYPDAELALFGIEEPACRIHSADESVSPDEIFHVGTAELLFLARSTR